MRKEKERGKGRKEGRKEERMGSQNEDTKKVHARSRKMNKEE